MEGRAMGQVLHGCATTTAAIRRAIQHSQESLRALAKRYGINQKTVAKWKKRTSSADLPTGPRDPKSTSLSIDDEAIIAAFRKHTLLPLDDCLYALPATIPHLTRSSDGDSHRLTTSATRWVYQPRAPHGVVHHAEMSGFGPSAKWQRIGAKTAVSPAADIFPLVQV